MGLWSSSLGGGGAVLLLLQRTRGAMLSFCLCCAAGMLPLCMTAGNARAGTVPWNGDSAVGRPTAKALRLSLEQSGVRAEQAGTCRPRFRPFAFDVLKPRARLALAGEKTSEPFVTHSPGPKGLSPRFGEPTTDAENTPACTDGPVGSDEGMFSFIARRTTRGIALPLPAPIYLGLTGLGFVVSMKLVRKLLF